MLKIGYVPAALLLLLAACEKAGPLDGRAPSFLRADVDGSVRARYEGTGEFWLGGAPGIGRPRTFGINSRRHAAADPAVSFWKQTGQRPGVGTYELRVPDYSSDSWESFAAVYVHQAGGMVEAFVARSGTLQVTASSADRVVGTFRFTGARYCARSRSGTPYQAGSCRPSEVSADAPTIEVSGSFVATPASHEAVALADGRR